jgi:hypothetical protein
MANLWQVMQDVKDIVRRPDYDQLVESRILAAIRACHAIAPCDRDLIEQQVLVGEVGSEAPAVIGTAELGRDFRLVATISGLDAEGNLIDELHKKTTSELAKLRKMHRDGNTYYIVNNKISFKAEVEVTALLVHGYSVCPPPSLMLAADGTRLPILEDNALGQYTDWILEMYEQAIIDYAVGYIEGLKGNKDLANIHQSIFNNVDREDILQMAATFSGT